MRNVNVLKVYNLVDSKGNKLRLQFGILRNRAGEVCVSNADKGYRWCFEGDNIPMPVRSRTWFNGFPEEIMLSWLKANGWCPQTCVSMCDGSAKVYELPENNGDGFKLKREDRAQEMYNRTISTALENYKKAIAEAKNSGLTACYISSITGKPPVEAIQALLDAGYDIVYHCFEKGYGDWFVQAFWHRPCEKGKLFKSEDICNSKIEVTIQDYKNE